MEQSNIQSGKARHRRRQYDSEWEDEAASPEEVESQKPISESNPVSILESEPALSTVRQSNSNQEIDFDQARIQSRKQYLKRRFDTKLKELENELKDLSTKADLTSKEREEYSHKLKAYNLMKEREELSENVSNIDNLYNLPSEYVTHEGKIDRKRKYETLNAKSKYDDSQGSEGFSKNKDYEKKNRYENQWELDQLKKAQNITGISQEKSDQIQLADQKDYEFVFDDSQFVEFTDDEDGLSGDEEEVEENVDSKRHDIRETRMSLPVYKLRDSFLQSVEKHQILIVVGETGSGKTTQLPQYLNEAGYSKGKNGEKLIIGCTQPRRVAATSVAARVSDEMGCKLGEEVGYNVRFDDNSSPLTIVKYLTDGMLLREFLTDPELLKYGAIMIDEAHERTVSTEIILSLLKDIIKIRPDLKLIVASATINAKKFSDFFNGAPIFNIPGRRFPVEIHYTKNPEANYIQAAITTIFQIHTTQDMQGDILVFLTGQEEIESMEEALNEAREKLGNLINDLIVAPIYANLPPDLQKRIFEPTPSDSRKVVLATNIAETSITIDGIAYVIDPGYVKENVYNPSTGMESLVVVPCSRASADQRAGRAGITDLIGFDFMDPPSPNTLMKALDLLYALGALNSRGNLTKTGRKMAEFPIDPMFSKCLIKSADYGVSDAIISIISLLSESSSLFYRPKDKKEQADKKKEAFNQEFGDHLTLLNIWEQWVETGYSNIWCQDHFIQYKALKRARDIREQLSRLCNRIGIETDKDDLTENKTMKIQKAITSGFFPHIARLSKMGDSYRSLKKNQPIFIHPSSSLHSVKPPPKLMLYHELVLTSKEYMRNCMLIDEKWLSELAPHYYSAKELESLESKRRK
ncbi:hypothetical protein QCA50_015987 [Cerrena zonata]|uniref:RNA helicase n=1 Tax=Cerrena zonata TaxID=2478898 RepID=A0AAW0FW47_9APHY